MSLHLCSPSLNEPDNTWLNAIAHLHVMEARHFTILRLAAREAGSGRTVEEGDSETWPTAADELCVMPP